MAQRTVITGGGGFLGSHLCDYFIGKGHEVVCLDNLLTGTARNIEHLFGHEQFTFVKYNVSEFIHVGGRVDNVLHFASPASPVDYLEFPIETLKVGALGTHKALGLAKAKGARFLLASTSEVYGDPLVHPQPETYWGNVNPVGPRGVYDEAKRFAEALTMAYHRVHQMDTKIVRIFNTYGPRMRLYDGRALPTFFRQALKGEPLTVYGDGLADAQLLPLQRPDGGHRPAPGERGARADQHRQPGGGHRAADRQGGDRGDRLEERDRLRAAARQRPARCASRTSRRRRRSWAGSRRSAAPTACG